MSDCCAEIKAELAILKAEIAKIKPVDEDKIIKKSIAGAEALIVPLIGTVVAARIAPVNSELRLLAAGLDSVAGSAAKALAQAGQALSKAVAAGATASAASKAASGSAGKLASLAAALASIAATVAGLKILGDRSDSLEGYLDSVSNDLSKALGIALKAFEMGGDARNKADQAIKESSAAAKLAGDAASSADNASRKADGATDLSKRAIATGENAVKQAESAVFKADQASATATDASRKADTATDLSKRAIATGESAIKQAESAVFKADQASATATDASRKADGATDLSKRAIATGENAIKQAESAVFKADQASATATDASRKADTATDLSKRAIATSENAAKKAEIADAKASEALSRSQGNQNVSAQNQQQLQDLRRGGVFRWQQNLANVQKGVTQFTITRTEQINTEVARLEAAYKLKAQTGDSLITALSKIDNLAQQQQATSRQVASISAVSPISEINNLNGQISQLKTENAGIKNQIASLNPTITQIKESLKEQDSMNKQGLAQLGNITSAVAALPTTLPNAFIASPTFTGAMTNVAAAGTCQASKPGGCLGKPLNNINNKLDGIDNLLNQLGISGLNAQIQGLSAQLTASTKAILDTTIAFQALMAAKFTSLFSFLSIDRLLNVFSAIGTLHNAYMLSSSIADTLFGAIDNVFQIFLKDAEGQDINTRNILGDTVDNWAKSIFGVSTWTGIKETWKKWNRIYQAGANIINSVRSIVDSVRNISEFIAENTGRIGNALKKFGVVGESAYKAMPERVNAQSIWVQRLQNLEEAASGIEMISSEVLSTVQNVNEINEQLEKFEESITDSPTKEQKENTAVKAAAVASKAASPGQDLSEEDKESDE